MKILGPARWIVPLAILFGALALRGMEPRVIQDLQLGVFDLYQRTAPREYTPVPVAIVDLDDETLARYGQWPWPRTLVAAMVQRLTELGAALVSFDVVFAEPDRTSPRNILELWEGAPEYERIAELLAHIPDHDEVLARSFAEGRVVTGYSVTNAPGVRAPARKAGFSWGGPDPSPFVAPFEGAVINLPELEEAAVGNGCFSVFDDSEVHRRVPLVFRMGDALYPSLDAETIRAAFGASTYMVKSVGASGEAGFGESTGITQVRIADREVPTDSRGRVWVHFTESLPQRYIPAWEILAGEVDPARIEGHLLYVGTSAKGLVDLRPTPVHPRMPGVEIHAMVAEQILLEHYLSRPDWTTGAELFFVLVVGLLVALLLPKLGALGCALLAAAAIGGAVAASWYAYTDYRLLIDPLFPSAAALSVYFSGSLLNFIYTESERRRIRHAFSHYLDPEFVKELAANPERLALGGESRELTVLFCDIRGFTTISEQFDSPQELTSLINRFLTPMTELIMARRGTIDKYMGDCIMAFWNAPLDDPAHAANAADSALAMLQALEKLNATLAAEAQAAGNSNQPLRIGIGLNSGDCCVGNLGSDQRFDYSAIGDEVNLASRLEGQSKTYGVDTVIGDNTRSQLGDAFATLELDRIRVKGKVEAVTIHTLVGDAETARSPQFRQLVPAHAELLEAYRGQEWELALSCANRCRRLGGAFGLGGLYDLYTTRVEAYIQEPPGPDWDGVYSATSK